MELKLPPAFPRRVFVTGTDTEVGKTVVSCALARALGARALKPVASGVERGAGEDAEALAAATGGTAEVAYAFRAPLSPHRAAALEGVEVERERVLAWIREREAPAMVVEGAGGWRVPLSPRWLISDLARDLGFPVVVVAADRLGCLNHTMLTVEAVRRDGLTVAAVVLNDILDRRQPNNLEDLRQLLPELTVIPYPRLA